MEMQMEWLNFSENFTLPLSTCYAGTIEIITESLSILFASKIPSKFNQ